jgi:hypothetical protein
MNLDEVICEVVQGGSCGVVFSLAGKPIRQTGVAAHLGPHGPILALNIAGGDVLLIEVPGHMANVSPDAPSG